MRRKEIGDTGGNRRFHLEKWAIPAFATYMFEQCWYIDERESKRHPDNAEEFGFHAGDLVQEWLWDDDG